MGKEALTAWVALQAVLANLFVLKQMLFFGYEVTCSDACAIGCILGLNLLQEFFGKESAVKAVWICFAAMLFTALMSQIHLLYAPSLHDTAHGAYQAILSSTPRLIAASLGTFFLVQQLDLRLFGALRKRCASAPLMVRNSLSLLLSQLLDTVLFSFLGLWGLVACLTDVICVSFFLKVLIILALAPFTALCRRLVRHAV
jgi:uncharacterized integral membrane protein (TIGR00697 family)